MKKIIALLVLGLISTNLFSQSNLTVQQRLNNGETPYEIFYNNANLLDSLNGKTYGGGLISYLDTTNGSALISAELDQSAGIAWGCLSTWLNTSDTLFGGFQNTIGITKTCGGTAALLCDTLTLNEYNDWYLPNKAECNLMYKNLKEKGYGNFDFSSWQVHYWTSNQDVGSSFSTAMRFWDGLTTGYTRTSMFRVRAIRKSTVLIFKGLVTGTVGSISEGGYTVSTWFNQNMPFGNIHSSNYGLSAPAMGVSPHRDDVSLYLTQNDGSNFGVSSVMLRTINSEVDAQPTLFIGYLDNRQWVEYRVTVPKGATYQKYVFPSTFRNIRALKWGSGSLIVSSMIELME